MDGGSLSMLAWLWGWRGRMSALPRHAAPHDEVPMHNLHRNLAGIRVGVKARQYGAPRHSVKIAAHQESPHAQAVLLSIRKDQVVMDLLCVIVFAQAGQ